MEPLFAEGKQWHSLRRFRLRRLWRVNIEALMIGAGLNLKRLLKAWGWGRRPCPSGAAMAVEQSDSSNFFVMVYMELVASSCQPGEATMETILTAIAA